MGPGWKSRILAPVSVSLYHVGSQDVARHQVRRELHAVELEVHRLGERLDDLGLSETRDALQQYMSAGEQAGDDPADDFLIADDDASDLGLDAIVAIAKRLDPAFDIESRVRQCGFRGHSSIAPSAPSALAVSRIMRK